MASVMCITAMHVTDVRMGYHQHPFWPAEQQLVSRRAATVSLQGFLQTALVVSSFHMLDIEAADGVVERTVRILYGEGDRYGCWLDVLAANIVWHELSDAAAVPASQPGADTGAEEVSGCPHKSGFHENSTLKSTAQGPS